jgi:hypothetical protein
MENNTEIVAKIDPFDVAMDRMHTVIATRKTRSNYKAKYKRFIQWVHNNIDNPMLGLEVANGGRFITRSNIDKCYINE